MTVQQIIKEMLDEIRARVVPMPYPEA
jgi:hypothetical protein